MNKYTIRFEFNKCSIVTTVEACDWEQAKSVASRVVADDLGLIFAVRDECDRVTCDEFSIRDCTCANCLNQQKGSE